MNKLTHEEYIDLLKNTNPNIEVLEKYNGRKNKILHRCKIHDIDFYTLPELILEKHNVCPQCISENKAKRMLKSHEQYLEELKVKYPHIIPIDNYIDSSTKIKHKCLLHNYQWEVTPNHLLKSIGCPKCRSEKERLRLTKTHETYLNELEEKHINLIPLEKYVNKKTKILHKCNQCGYEWKVIPDNILQGSGCPKCQQKSKGEIKIEKWLISHDINFDFQKRFDDCKAILTLPFDFYLPNFNKCIEFDGKQHFEPNEHFGGQIAFEDLQKHDQIKTEYCKANNIPLLRIPYYANVEKELETFLLN